MKNKALMLLFAAMYLVFLPQTFADDEDPNIMLIETRQGEMEIRAFSVKPLFDMAKGKIPYDAKQAAALANNLKVLMQLDIGAAWAPGTGMDKYPDDTEAKPEIWSNYPEVQKHGEEYAAAVEALVPVAGNGLDALRSNIGAVGDACKGCHDDFRKEE